MMKEFLMHSALMWHLAQNFQTLYAKDLKQMELFKKNTWTAYTYNSSTPKDYDLLTLRFYTAFQLLTSHSLNVDTENIVLGFLFHSSRI